MTHSPIGKAKRKCPLPISQCVLRRLQSSLSLQTLEKALGLVKHEKEEHEQFGPRVVWLSLMKIKVPRKIKQYFMKYVWAHIPRKFHESKKSVSVLIPLAVKDLHNVAITIQSIKKNLLHPIDEIIIVGQSDKKISNFCRLNNLKYINEEDILSKNILEINLAQNGQIINGWIKQQLIKLNAFNYIDAENILVHDADTIFVRPISFINEDNKQILYISDEYIKNYHEMTNELIGPLKRYKRSFIAHDMLFQRDLMNNIHKKIFDKHKLNLDEAVIFVYNTNLQASLSEYELYGNYLDNFHKDRFIKKYWFNHQITKNIVLDTEYIEKKYSRFNTVSYHIRPNHKKRKRLLQRIGDFFKL